MNGSAGAADPGAILILGSPRSGTSWLAKLFDSHPDVLYRHEPDMVHRPDCLPKWVPPSEDDAHIDTARAYLDTLVGVRTLRTAGPLPVLAKRHRTPLGRVLRTGFILGVRGLEMATRNHPGLSRVQIPDLLARRSPHQARLVVKSVNLLAHVRLFAKAWPQGRLVVIVRHPCGQVASLMRGVELGVMPWTRPDEHAARRSDAAALSEQAERLGLRIERYSTLSFPEQMAWQWAYQNQRALQDIEGLSNIRLVIYEELAADPIGVARDLFEFAGLSWEAQVERFIRDSTRHHESRYYGVRRNPLQAANRWREALSVEDQQRIAAIASRVPIGRAFFVSAPDRRSLSLSPPVPEGPVAVLREPAGEGRPGFPRPPDADASRRPHHRPSPGRRSPVTPPAAAAKRP